MNLSQAAALGAFLIVISAPTRAVATDTADDAAKVEALKWHWKGGETDAGRKLLEFAAPGRPDRADVLLLLASGDEKAMGPLIPDLEALAAQAGHDPDMFTRQAGGELMQTVIHWKNFSSPSAIAGGLRQQAKDRRERLEEILMMSAMPLAAILGTIWVVLSRSTMVWLLLGSSAALTRAFGDAGAVVTKEHRAFLLMPAAAVVAAAVVGLTAWQAVSLVGPQTSAAQAGVLAWRAILSARVLIAYFTAGFAFYFMHAMFLSMMIDVARGRSPDFAAAFSRAAARAKEIAGLSAAVFAGLLLVELGLRATRRAAAGAGLGYALDGILRLAAWLLETGVTVASTLMVAISIGDDVGFIEAARRATSIMTHQARPAMLAIMGIEAVESDLVLALPSMFFMLGFACLPLSVTLFPDGFSAGWGLPLGVTDVHVLVYGGLILGALSGAFMYSGTLALESIFAAALYSYAGIDAVHGPIYARLAQAAPNVAGLLARAPV